MAQCRLTLNLLVLVKPGEQYVWLYADSQAEAAIQTLGRFAADPGLSLTWYDAAALSQKIRERAPLGKMREGR